MARQISIEEESGTCTGWMHPHNGYYAGDFAAGSLVTSRPTSIRSVATKAPPASTCSVTTNAPPTWT
jgi:hypothetical protein